MILTDIVDQRMPDQAPGDDLPATVSECPGIEIIPVHNDIRVAESNRLLSNTDPRFGDLGAVVMSRLQLATAVGADYTIVMVPAGRDGFHDLTSGPVIARKEGYKNWPSALQPIEDQEYDPARPPKMFDLPTDSLLTRTPGRGLMLAPADCAAGVIYDPTHRALALVHVGREGANLDIASKVLKHMTARHGTSPHDVVAYFGLSIAPESYVLPMLNEAMRQEAWRPFLRETLAGFETDFVGYTAQRLLEHGVNGANISRSLVDVAAHPDYFSYTEHKQTGVPNGRNALIAAIR